MSNDSTDLIFEEPPRTRTGSGGMKSPIAVWLATLRAHPGKWAKYPTPVHHATRTFISKGHAYGVAAGEFEATTRGAGRGPGGKSDLYARYVGGES